MKKYRVHFSGYWKYDVDIEAENENAASRKAFDIFENTPTDEFWFEDAHKDVWEVTE